MSSTKTINFYFLIIALLVYPTFLSAQSASPDPYRAPLYEDLSRTYGFCSGQRISIERIQKEFPDLAPQVIKAQMEFDLVFKSSYENIEKTLREILGNNWGNYKVQMQKQLEKLLGALHISRVQAEAFVQEVSLRASGQIESPVLETLLTYNPEFQKNPEKEFLRGFTETYRTKSHPKAKGVDFQIQYPKSWKAKEGKRPNVIQLITSENGRGFDSLVLMVKDIPLPAGYKITDEELSDLFTPSSLKETLPEGTLFISAKPIVLDRRKGGMLIFDQVRQRVDITMKMRSLHFITIYDNKMIFVQS